MGVRGFAVEGLEALPDGDTVLDFEVTANRPDCTSVRGLAREVATAYDLPLKDIAGLDTLTPGTREPFTVDIDRPDLCGRYVGAFAAVSVAPSPQWLQARLRACGVRPINNVVDVTNYVLLELGQPMHAFDMAKLAGPAIRVRAGGARRADPDAGRPGSRAHARDAGDRRRRGAGRRRRRDGRRRLRGLASTTRSVVLESASFNPTVGAPHQQGVGPQDRGQHAVRARRRSRASAGGDGAGLRAAAAARREARRARRSTATPSRSTPRAAASAAARDWPACSDSTVPDADVLRILRALGFMPDLGGRRLGRHRPDQPRGRAARGGPDRGSGAAPRLRPYTDATFPVLARAAAAKRSAHRAGAPPARRDDRRRVLRGDDVRLHRRSRGGAVCASGRHRRHRQPALGDVRGAAALARCRACSTASATTAGASSPTCGCSRSARASRAPPASVARLRSPGPARPIRRTGRRPPSPVTFFDAKGVVERICLALGVPASIEADDGRLAGCAASPRPWSLAAPSARLVRTPGAPVCRAPRHPRRRCGVRRRARSRRRVQPAARRRRASRRCPASRPSRETSRCWWTTRCRRRRCARPFAGPRPTRWSQVREFDRYQGKGIPDGKISLAIRLTFRSPDRTLTDGEVQAAMDQVVAAVRAKHGAVQR